MNIVTELHQCIDVAGVFAMNIVTELQQCIDAAGVLP